MKKYLFIVLLVGVWSCEDSHTHDEFHTHDTPNTEDETDIEINVTLRWIVLRSCSNNGGDDYIRKYHTIQGNGIYSETSVLEYT